jgi:ABC-type uncharacterized transport system involved in gliding motility auxiliary subunit
MRIDRQTRIQLTIQKAVFLFLFLGIIGMLAWLTDHYQWQFDFTANKRHSISQESTRLLDKLPGEIVLHAYTRDEVTGQAITEIISRYQRHKDDFTLRLLNPDIDIVDVQKDGVVMNTAVAFVVHYQGRMEHIESLSEQSISNALLRLNRASDQKVVFITGHGEFSIGQSERSYSRLTSRLSEMGINIEAINLAEKAIPGNTRLLVIAAPRADYLPGELSLISEQIAGGTNLLWLSEPGDLHGLESLATSFGIQLQQGAVIDNNAELRRMLKIDHPSFIPVTEYFQHPITETIRYNSLLPTARGISPLTRDAIVDNWQVTALFNSLAGSWSESDGLGTDEVSFSSLDGDVKGPITLAVALQRNRADDGSGDDQSTSGQQRVVITGDSDFLSDTYIGAGANLNLGLNIFNWLVGDDDYINIEVKPAADIRLEFDDTSLFAIAFGYFIFIPLGFIATGFIIWHRRNRR